MTHFKSNKNYTRLLNSLNFTFPGVPKVPRAPDAYSDRDLVDVYIAKRRLELVHRLPVFNLDALRATHIENSSEQYYGLLNRTFLSNLLASGYSSVVEELTSLAKEEETLLANREDSGRTQSFTEDKTRLEELVQGLISCAKAEKSDKISQKVRTRKSLGEKMIILGDFWLARKMFVRTFAYMEFYEDEELDKMRVELWCLLSYLCIYYEESQSIGYDLPNKCLQLAQALCRGKEWNMQKTVMSIFVPKTINVYGLKNDWLKVKADWMNVYGVVTTLLHVLNVKKARYWQDELKCLKHKKCDQEEKEREWIWIKENITEALTSALAYADEVGQYTAFIATTLRRGLFFEEQGDMEKAMEDFNAMYVLSINYGEKEATAVALNRIGHNYKASRNCGMALEHFAREWELSFDSKFEELQADALQDLGIVLLEEGLTWEADECVSQANSIFRETKLSDTPNDLDDLTWAMMGVTRGQHLWGRFTTLIRSQEKSKLDAIYDWKMLRKGFPLASMPQKWYKTQTRADFEQQYQAYLPVKKSKSSSGGGKKGGGVKFNMPEEDQTRRFFEFTPSEVAHRPSIWFQEKGYNNLFDFINDSDKPRVLPTFHDSFDGSGPDWLNEVMHSLTELRMSSDDLSTDTITRRRKTEAHEKMSSMGRSFTSMRARKTMSGKGMEDWIRHDFRVKSWKRKVHSLDRWKKMMDPNLGVGERLVALLDDMDDIAHIGDDDNNYDNDDGLVVKFYANDDAEEEDESLDSELAENFARQSVMDSALMEEFQNFDDKQLGF